MKKVHGKPITGAKPQMKAKPPIKTDANKTSLQAEQQIKQPPQPFANAKGAAKTPAPATFSGGVKPMTKNNIGHKALPNMKNVGQTRPISHAGNVFGRFGTKHPKKLGASPTQKRKPGAAFFGE